jgi:hypothetical protein
MAVIAGSFGSPALPEPVQYSIFEVQISKEGKQIFLKVRKSPIYKFMGSFCNCKLENFVQ